MGITAEIDIDEAATMAPEDVAEKIVKLGKLGCVVRWKRAGKVLSPTAPPEAPKG